MSLSKSHKDETDEFQSEWGGLGKERRSVNELAQALLSYLVQGNGQYGRFCSSIIRDSTGDSCKAVHLKILWLI